MLSLLKTHKPSKVQFDVLAFVEHFDNVVRKTPHNVQLSFVPVLGH